MKKISYNDAAYILRHKKNCFFEKYACNWYITLNNPNEGRIECSQKLWFYILTFIPVHIIAFFYCVWDLGIKNFELQPINIHGWHCLGYPGDGSDTQLGRLVEIWNKYN